MLKLKLRLHNCTDLVGYESIISFLSKASILSVEGDFVEIGTFLGGGARKLSKFLAKNKSMKTLHVIDVFDPSFDWTENLSGRTMAALYRKVLECYGGKSQFEVFSDVTKDCNNINVIRADSAKAVIPSGNLCFAMIDGNHDPEYIENDFRLVWHKMSSGGVVVFHDYQGDLPQTTAAINKITMRYNSEIKKLSQDREKWLLFVIKK